MFLSYLPFINYIICNTTPKNNGVGVVPNMPSVSAEMPPSTNIANTELPLTPIVTLN